jgi:putative membrane protein
VKVVWGLLGALVLAQIGYPLVDGSVRAGLVMVTVVVGYAFSTVHAALSGGWQTVLVLVLVTTGGGLVVEAAGVATGFPFGGYEYSDTLGPKLFGVPLVIPLAWTWMAWPAWLAAGVLASRPIARVPVAGLALASWDLFLDPQMVAEGYWRWADPSPSLPGVPDIPISNYVAWLFVATAMMGLLVLIGRPFTTQNVNRVTGLAMYWWVYGSSVLAHAVFLDLRASAVWGGLGMGLVAVPLAVTLARRRRVD